MVDAAVIVRTAREKAQLSARDLAAKAGVSASTVTRIERGEINPTLGMLDRLLDASGSQLVVTVQPRPTAPTLDAVREYRDEIIATVASFGGSNVRVFGSVARGDAHDGSDVDLVIDVPARTGLITVERIADALETILPWPVDIVTSGAGLRRMAHVLDEAVSL